MSEKKLLIKFDSNYADEFDVAGFTIMTESEWEQHKLVAAKVFEKFAARPKDSYGRTMLEYGGTADGPEVYFGTNEQISFEGGLKGYLEDFKVTEVTDEEVALIKKMFLGPNNSYGILPMLNENSVD